MLLTCCARKSSTSSIAENVHEPEDVKATVDRLDGPQKVLKKGHHVWNVYIDVDYKIANDLCAAFAHLL